MGLIDIRGQVVGAERVVARLTDAGVGYSKRVPMTVHALGLRVLARVKEVYLSGRALNVRSGRLRRSVNEKFTEDGYTSSSSVGTNLAYGRFWELGFHGLEEVKAHTRRITMAWGREIEPRVVQVSAHERKVDQKPRPFLQPSLADMKNEIRAGLVHAIEGRE